MIMNRWIFLMLLLGFVIVAADAAETDRQECGDIPGKTLSENEVLFAYSVDGKLDALTLFNGMEFRPVDGREFKHVTTMYNFSDHKRYSISFDAYWTRLGKDRCIWFARLPENAPRNMSIFSSRKFDLNTKPDPKTVELFYSINTDCVDQGDPQAGERIPCKRPELLATSDLNSNGRMEFWYSVPYTWDTGFNVAELSESGDKFDILTSKCLDCD
jgi:hypothetical protein